MISTSHRTGRCASGSPELPGHVQDFGFVAVSRGGEYAAMQILLNILASEIMGTLHDALDEAKAIAATDSNVSWSGSLFCLFADNTGIFQPPRHLCGSL